jgi:hypothetical protein
MPIYEVTAWRVVPHYTVFDVDATDIREALEKARVQARDEYGEPCIDGECDWDEFELHPEGDEGEILTYLAPQVLARNAATELLDELQRGLSLAQNVVDSWEHADLAAAVRALSQWSEEARAIIAKATPG